MPDAVGGTRRSPPAADLRIQLFGDVRVVRDDGAGVESLPPTPATVLAVLALAAPEPVSRVRLVDALWGDHPPRAAVSSLQAHVSRLRAVLEPDREPLSESVLATAGDGYRLGIEADATDVGRFRRAVAQAVTADDWRAALELAHGTPLGGCADTLPIVTERRALEEERLGATESWARVAIASGGAVDVIGELERLVSRHPLRERLWALLVRALHAASRRSEALDAYRRARDVLVETAGVEPGSELQAAQRAALDDEPTPSPRREPQASGAPVPGARTPLIGRDRDLDEVAALLDRWRLVTVVGPGGTGKTAFAKAVARRIEADLPGGAAFVDLTAARQPDEVLGVVAAATGVRLVDGAADVVEAVVDRVSTQPSLLLVDNCEHVLGEVARIVDRLIDSAEPLLVLATSRAPLGVGGERVVPLDPLGPEHARELFLERAEARRPGTAVAASGADVDTLCERLDRLPLAIELAASRTDHLQVSEILAAVTDTVAPVRRLGPEVDRRHASLDAAIRWSYDLLDERLQAVLRRLAVFRGPFDRDQAAAVAADVLEAGLVGDALGELVLHSLVTVDRTSAHSTYRLLETIRSFTAGELERHGELAETARRHRDWYVAWARREPAGHSTLDLGASYALSRHRLDLVAALEHAEREDDRQELAELAVLAGGLTFAPAGLPHAGRWTSVALDRSADVDPAVRADLLGVGAVVAGLRDDIAACLEMAREVTPLVAEHPGGAGPIAIAMALSTDDILGEAAAAADRLLTRGDDVLRPDVRHDLEGMRPLATLFTSLDPAVALERVAGVWEGRRWSDRRTLATWTIHAALLHLTGAHEELRERLATMERVPDHLGPPTYFASVFEALTDAVDGDVATARDHVRRAKEEHWGSIPGIASDLLCTLGVIAAIDGDEERARTLLSTPRLRPRHPGTASVNVWYLLQLGLPAETYLDGWWGQGRNRRLIERLDEELDR